MSKGIDDWAMVQRAVAEVVAVRPDEYAASVVRNLDDLLAHMQKSKRPAPSISPGIGLPFSSSGRPRKRRTSKSKSSTTATRFPGSSRARPTSGMSPTHTEHPFQTSSFLSCPTRAEVRFGSGSAFSLTPVCGHSTDTPKADIVQVSSGWEADLEEPDRGPLEADHLNTFLGGRYQARERGFGLRRTHMFSIFDDVWCVLAHEDAGSAVLSRDQRLAFEGLQISPEVALRVGAKGPRRIELHLEVGNTFNGQRDDERPNVIPDIVEEEVWNLLRCLGHPEPSPTGGMSAMGRKRKLALSRIADIRRSRRFFG